MSYEIRYYNSSVEEAVLGLPIHLRACYFSLADRREIFGAHLGKPHTKALGDGLFDLRLKSAEGIAGVFYCTLIGRQIVMLHSFVKKSQKNTG